MDTLILNEKIFSKIISSIKDQSGIDYSDSLNVTINKLPKLEASPIYPLMIFLLRELYENKILEETVILIFNYLINCYVRRNIFLKPKSSNIMSKAI